MYFFSLQMGNWFLGRISWQPKSHTNTWQSWVSIDSKTDIPCPMPTQAELKEDHKMPYSPLSRREKGISINCTFKNIHWRGDRDGGVKECETHLPNMNTSTYTWIHLHLLEKQSHWKQTGNWQKHSCTTKARITVHTESGKKGGEVIRLRSVPWKVDQRKREITQEQRSSLGDDWFEPHISALVLGSDKGKTSSLGWLEGLWE